MLFRDAIFKIEPLSGRLWLDSQGRFISERMLKGCLVQGVLVFGSWAYGLGVEFLLLNLGF